MKIQISRTSPDALNHDALILGFFSDERPPRGYCGLVDWRLNGLISTGIAEGRISGDFNERLLYAVPGRIRIDRLILFGLGPLALLTYDRLYNGGLLIAETALGIHATDLVLPVPAAGRGPLKLPGTVEALLTGLFDGFSGKPASLSPLRIEIPADAGHEEEIRAGLSLFRAQAGAAGIDILPCDDGHGVPQRRDAEQPLPSQRKSSR